MKKIFLFVVMFVVSQALLFAQESNTEVSPENNPENTVEIKPKIKKQDSEDVILFNPIGFGIALANSTFDASCVFQKKINPYLSLVVVPDIAYSFGYSLLGVSLGGGLGIHPIGKGLNGFYITLLPSLGSILTNGTIFFEFSGTMGWQWIFDNGFTLNLGAGVGVNSISGTNFKLRLLEMGFAL